ncbi:MAG: DegT/DnrJ/EryC1/StrS family aminotransferase [Proteobacteria bacterium]|nr:DegT/DnrJ/EryC1/StrS family aminotransferase [Pseudomonadota bacterium]
MNRRSPISVFGCKVGPEELAEVKSSFDRQWLGIGEKVQAFEAQFARRLDLGGFVMLDSGSNSLNLAVSLLDLPRGTEVILPSFTWLSCAHAVLLAGCVPVFADVDLRTQNITVDTIRPCISPRTGAIMVVHYAGKPVRMKEVMALGYPVIEDAAHAVDSRLDGQSCGAIGAIGIFSFDAVKNLAVGEGGGLTARDPATLARARAMRYCGIEKSGFQQAANPASQGRWWEYDIAHVCHKYLPSDVTASIGLAQLRKLDMHQAIRKRIWDRYQHEFADVEWLVRPADAEPDERHSYFTYCVRILPERGSGVNRRDRFARYLLDRGIYTTLRYHPLHMNRIYNSQARLPVSEQLNEEALSLPIHPNLDDADIDHIVATVRGFN